MAQATSFDYLAQDDVGSKSMFWRGEKLERIARYALRTPTGVWRYRFYLTSEGKVADFSAEQSQSLP